MKKMIIFVMLTVVFCAKGFGQTVGTETEPNNNAATANTLVLGSYAPNEARDSGCHINPAGDVDFYKVDIPQGGVLDVTIPINSTGMTFDITIIDSATYTVLYSGYGGAPFTLETLICGGTYYISIDIRYGGGSPNSYGLVVNFYPDASECNNTEPDAYPIQPNDTITAYIRGYNNTLPGVIDVDYYKVTIPDGGVLRINMPINSTGLTFDVNVIDSATNTALYTGYSAAPLTDEVLVCGGTYYIYVDDRFGSATSDNPYVLYVNFYPDATECNNTEAEAYPIRPNDTITGYIRGYNALTGGIDVDYYKVTIPDGGVLRINMPINSTGLTFDVNVIDSATNTALYTGYSAAPLTDEVLVCGGTYYIYVDDRFGSATSDNPYVLYVNFYPDATECNNTEAEAYLLHPNDTVVAYLRGYNNTLLGGSIDRDYYKVVNENCGFLTANIPINSTSIAFQLQIIDSASGTLLSNNIGAVGGAVTDAISITPGTYYIYVQSSSFNTDPNPYTLYINLSQPYIGVITGAASVCAGSTITLTDVAAGGPWSSAFGGIATVTSGTVTGVSAGTSTISYNVNNVCGTGSATKVITVNPLPVAGTITGTAGVCIGAVITLTDGAGSGTWSASNSNATVAGGVVTGVSAGTDIISYSATNACGTVAATKTVTINTIPVAGTVAGAVSVCVGSVIILTDGVTDGVWSASNSNATVVGGLVTGEAAGTDIISYSVTNYCGTIAATENITVNAPPTAGIITGAVGVCIGATATLTDGVTGGSWSVSNSNAAVASGLLTGVTAGTDIISYLVANTCGSAAATETITVNPLPSAGAITGTASVCIGATSMLIDGVTAGAWSASNVNATVAGGLVTGVTAGTDIISYSVTNSCGTIAVTESVTIDPLPGAGTVMGAVSVCIGATITLTDGATGGTWSASNSDASVAGGLVTGVAAGIDIISYSVTNSCGTTSAEQTITISTSPDAGTITGLSSACVGVAITLTDGITGGTWTCSTVGVATIGSSTGVVTGESGGTAMISYSVTNMCATAAATAIVTINALPAVSPITGIDSICIGISVSLSDLAPDGTWGNITGNTTVSTAGIVTGFTPGIDTIDYTVTTPECGSAAAVFPVYVVSMNECNTGVNPLEANSGDIQIYPNPLSTTVHIKAPVKVNVTILNVVGQVVLEQQNATDINMGGVANGIYIIKVYDENNVILKTEKLVKAE